MDRHSLIADRIRIWTGIKIKFRIRIRISIKTMPIHNTALMWQKAQNTQICEHLETFWTLEGCTNKFLYFEFLKFLDSKAAFRKSPEFAFRGESCSDPYKINQNLWVLLCSSGLNNPLGDRNLFTQWCIVFLYFFLVAVTEIPRCCCWSYRKASHSISSGRTARPVSSCRPGRPPAVPPPFYLSMLAASLNHQSITLRHDYSSGVYRREVREYRSYQDGRKGN